MYPPVIIRKTEELPDGSVHCSSTRPDGWLLVATGEARVTGGYWSDFGFVPSRIAEPTTTVYQLDGEVRGTRGETMEYLAGQGWDKEDGRQLLTSLPRIRRGVW